MSRPKKLSPQKMAANRRKNYAASYPPLGEPPNEVLEAATFPLLVAAVEGALEGNRALLKYLARKRKRK